MSLKLVLKGEKPVEALPGTGYCPKKKGGRRYQIEVLQEMCRHCIESDTELTTNVPEGEFRLYKCKNGLVDGKMLLLARCQL